MTKCQMSLIIDHNESNMFNKYYVQTIPCTKKLKHLPPYLHLVLPNFEILHRCHYYSPTK